MYPKARKLPIYHLDVSCLTSPCT